MTDDVIFFREYLHHNSTEWEHYKQCRDMFRDMTDAGGELGDFVYRQLEPILFGKIPYSPATAQVNETIRRANETFRVSQRVNSCRLAISTTVDCDNVTCGVYSWARVCVKLRHTR